MKKVALLHYAYPPNIGGVEILMKEHAHILAELGYQVTILTGSGKESHPQITLYQIDKLQSLLNINPKLQEKIIDNKIIDKDFYHLSSDIEKILNHYLTNIDTIIIHNMLTVFRNLPFIYAFHQFAKNNPSKKIIVWVHDHMYIGNEKIKFNQINQSHPLEKQLLTSSIPGAKYIVISQTFKHLLIQVMSIPPDNVIVIPNGIWIKNFLEIEDNIWEATKKHQLLESFPFILSPVNVLERKNLEYSLEIIFHLKKFFPKICYLVSGQPSKHRSTIDYLKKLKDKIAALNLKKQVIFLGEEITVALKDEEIHDLYSLADLIFYFSKSENFGLPILEASLTKTPIFVSNLKVFHEVGNQFINYIDYQTVKPLQAAEIIKKFIEQNPILLANYRSRTQYNLETIIKEKLVPIL